MVTHVVFDWGDTLMRDFPELPGPMAHWEKVVVINGVEEVLRILAEKYVLVVATNANFSGVELMSLALERGGIKKYFSHFYSSIDLGFSKPDSRFFLAIINDLKINAYNAVMIGNDYTKDIVGAKNIGMQTILFNEKKNNMHAVLADHVAAEFADIPDIIKKWTELNKDMNKG